MLFLKPRYEAAALTYGNQLELTGFRIRNPNIGEPYKKVEVDVLLKALQNSRKNYLIQVDIFDINGVSLEQVPPVGPTDADRWAKDDVRPVSTYFIYEPKKPAPYIAKVMVSLLDPDTKEPLSISCNPQPCDPKIGDLRFMMDARTTAPWREAPAQYRINENIDVLSIHAPTTIAAGETLNLDMVWRAVKSSDHVLSSFVHVLNAQGDLVAQSQSPDLTTRYPTTVWSDDEIVMGQVQVALPDTLPTGQYTLRYGMYALDTLARQKIAAVGPVPPANNDLIEIGSIQVTR